MLTSELRHSGGIVDEVKRSGSVCLQRCGAQLIGSDSNKATALLRVLLMEAVTNPAAFRRATRRSRQ
jgi:hypothetical protein